MGWSANMAKIMAAQATSEDDPMFKMMRDLPKVLEINPKSPLIEGLLERVLDLSEDSSSTEQEELSETAQVLFDTTLVRSGFTVSDSDT
jgi:heat shock protein beta